MFPFKFIIIFSQLKYILRLQCSIISWEMYLIHTNFKIIQLFLTCERQPRCLNTVRIIGWQKPTSNHHDKIGLTLFNVRSTNILVLRVLAAPICEYTQTFYNLKIFADFLNVCSTNILVLTGLQHQYIGAVQGEPNCLQHHAYLFKRCLFNLLE
jgi:hypothetical protein